jgi:WXG100 family type VII secretion target
MGLPSWMPGRPGGDPDALRRYAGMWDALNSSLSDMQNRTRPQADNVSAFWRGVAADAYHGTWSSYEANFGPLHDAIDTMARQLRDAAQKIDDAQNKYDHYAEAAAAVAAAGIGLTIFTLGISDAVAAGSEGGIAAAASAVIAELATALEAIGGFIADCYATIGTLVLQLQLSLTPLQGLLLTGAAGAVTFGGGTYLSGDHNAWDVAAASAFGFLGTADPEFGMSTGGTGASAASSEQLIQRVQQAGGKIDPDAVVRIDETADGNVVWLETGNGRAGLQHILDEHAQDFVNKGIAEADIPDVVMQAVREGNVVGSQGAPPGRPIYETTYQGQTVRIAVTVGSNGFVVGANPVSGP